MGIRYRRRPGPRPARATLAGVAILVATIGVGPTYARAQDGEFSVLVIEGTGLGHGLGLPLDGAAQLAAEGADADEILDRFYPGTGTGTGSGLVRVLVAEHDDPALGFEATFPHGGSVRDGRNVAVAPSFPIRIPAGGTARITFHGELYRAEVLDGASVSGTREITPTSANPPPEDGAPTSTFPGLGASSRSVWLEPTAAGTVTLDGGVSLRDPLEVVVEAERMHVIAETELEPYVAGLVFTPEDIPPPEGAALEAAVIAARSYALRASQAAPRVGGFTVWADERSFHYVGAERAGAAVGAAARDTARTVRTFDDSPIAGMVTVGAAGQTAGLGEVSNARPNDYPYLAPVDYEGGQELRWRVELRLTDAARSLGYDGEPTQITVASRGPSGRPRTIVISGSAGDVEVDTARVHEALRLPSSRFEIDFEPRTGRLAEYSAGEQFQELPGRPLEGVEPEASIEEGRRNVPMLIAVGAAASLALAAAILGVAHLRRRLVAARARRSSLERHPTSAAPPVTAPDAARLAVPGEGDAPRPARPAPPMEGPTWHNEPEWLDDLLSGDPADEETAGEGAAGEEADDDRG